MEITEVRIKLMESSEDRLRGFCSVTFDTAFVVRDLKIIEGNSGPFVAMPSRKLTANCNRCHSKNHLRANYCNNCGQKLKQIKPQQGFDGRAKLYADIAHPINAACREMIQNRVIEELEKERKLSSRPGYRSRYDETYDAGPEVDSDDYVDAEKDLESKTSKQRETRVDAKHDGPSKPHSDDNSTSTTKSSPRSGNAGSQPKSSSRQKTSQPPKEVNDDFGDGVFD